MNAASLESLISHFKDSQQFFFLITDTHGHFIHANSLFERHASRTLSQLVSFNMRDFIEENDVDHYYEVIKHGLQKKSAVVPADLRYNFRNGYYLQVAWEVCLPADERGLTSRILWTGAERGERATENKTNEVKPEDREFFYREVISKSLDGILMADMNGEITYCGPSVTKVSGYKTERLLGHNLFEFVHPDDIDSAKEVFDLELKNQNERHYIFLRLMHSDGEWKWYSVRGHNLFETPGINSMVIYFTEETRRKLVEDKLEESENRFRNLINNLRLGVVLQNERTEILVCNKAALNLLGLTEDQLLGKTSFDPEWNIIHEDGSDFPSHSRPVPLCIQTKKAVTDVVMGVYRPLKGDRVWLLVNAEPIFNGGESIANVICSFTDITEQRKLSQQLVELEIQKQKQLMQATIDGQEKERMEIGRELHDNISQHITTTRLYLEVAKEHAAGELLDLIQQAHNGLLNTVTEIRKLSQALVPPSLNDIGLIEAIEDLCSPISATHAFAIKFIHRPFDESLLPGNMKLMVFRIIQEQVNNIIRHAGADSINIALQTLTGQLKLSVTDNGRGFDLATVKKGLGLDNISNRAGLFGGTLDIKSSPGNGCSINVSIPLAGK